MWDFRLGDALSLMLKTSPYILFRLMVYFGIAAAYVIVTGVGAGAGWVIGFFGTDDFQASSTFFGGVIGFAITAGVIYLLREYLLYMVKAGHIAVLVEMIDGRPLPEGQGQVSYGTAVVKERFAQSSTLFALDLLVKGVIKAISKLVQSLTSILPIPGVDGLMNIFKAFLRMSIGFVDEVILAHAIRTRSDNPWASAREALVLYAQNYQVMLKNAAFLALFIYFLAFLVFLIMLAPAGLVVYLLPGSFSAGVFIFAVLFAWAFKAALLEPLAITCMMQVYFKTTEGQQPRADWDAKLSELSDKFQEIKEKAFSEAPPAGSAAPQPGPA